MKGRGTLRLAPDHPAFAGHFPTFPVLPGAVLLDEILRMVERDCGIDLLRWQIASSKFLGVVRPADVVEVEHEAVSPSSIRFTVRVGDRKVASGVLSEYR